MTTEKQIEANRANAQLSTGPRTEAGKAASSGNALRHGLTAQRMLLAGEDPDEFESFRQDLYSKFAPASALESELVGKLIDLLWRVRRAPAFEAALVAWSREVQILRDKGRVINLHPDARQRLTMSTEQTTLGRAVSGLFEQGDHLTKLARYENHLMRQIEKTLQLLRQAQGGERQAEKTPVAMPTDAVPPKVEGPIASSTGNRPDASAEFTFEYNLAALGPTISAWVAQFQQAVRAANAARQIAGPVAATPVQDQVPRSNDN